MSFGQDVLNAHDPRYMSQYYAMAGAQSDDYFERKRIQNEIRRRMLEENYAKDTAFNAQQRSRPTAAEANPQESIDSYWQSRANDRATIAANRPSAEQLWGDELNGGSMSPVEFQQLQDKLIGGGDGGASGATAYGPAAAGPTVTRSMHLDSAPAVTFNGLNHGAEAAGQMATEGAAMGIGGGILPFAPVQNEPGFLSGSTGKPIMDRLAGAVGALPDSHPEKAVYSELVGQLQQGNVHAIPQALQQRQAQPDVSESLGNAIQQHKDRKAKDFAQAMSMLDQMRNDGKHSFDQLAGYFKQIQRTYPELAAGHVRGMTSGQIQLMQKHVEEETVRQQVDSWNKQLPPGTMPMPRENYLGRDAKGKRDWVITPSEWVSMQREQATASHQVNGEQLAVSNAQDKHNMGLFAAEMKMYQGMIPKPLPEGADVKTRAAHSKRMQIAMDGMADVQSRMTTGGAPHAATMSQDYRDAQAEEDTAAGAAAQQATAAKQDVAQQHVATQQGQLQLGQDKLDYQKQHDAEVNDPIKQQQAELGKAHVELAKQGIVLKQAQIKQANEKITQAAERNRVKDEQFNKRFAEIQKKNLSQEQATQVGQAMKAVAMKKPQAPDMMTQLFASFSDDQITPKNQDQVNAAKLQVKLFEKERTHYDGMVKTIQDYTDALVPKGAAKPAEPAKPTAFTSGPEAFSAFKAGQLKAGESTTINGVKGSFDSNGKFTPDK